MRWGVALSGADEAKLVPNLIRGIRPSRPARARSGRLLARVRGVLRSTAGCPSHDRGSSASLARPLRGAHGDRAVGTGQVRSLRLGTIRVVGLEGPAGRLRVSLRRVGGPFDGGLSESTAEPPRRAGQHGRARDGARDGGRLLRVARSIARTAGHSRALREGRGIRERRDQLLRAAPARGSRSLRVGQDRHVRRGRADLRDARPSQHARSLPRHDRSAHDLAREPLAEHGRAGSVGARGDRLRGGDRGHALTGRVDRATGRRTRVGGPEPGRERPREGTLPFSRAAPRLTRSGRGRRIAARDRGGGTPLRAHPDGHAPRGPGPPDREPERADDPIPAAHLACRASNGAGSSLDGRRPGCLRDRLSPVPNHAVLEHRVGSHAQQGAQRADPDPGDPGDRGRNRGISRGFVRGRRDLEARGSRGRSEPVRGGRGGRLSGRLRDTRSRELHGRGAREPRGRDRRLGSVRGRRCRDRAGRGRAPTEGAHRRLGHGGRRDSRRRALRAARAPSRPRAGAREGCPRGAGGQRRAGFGAGAGGARRAVGFQVREFPRVVAPRAART